MRQRIRAFSVGAARAQGVGAEALRAGGQYAVPFRGVRTTGEPRDLFERCVALSTVLHDDVVFSHVTALRLLGVDVPWTVEDDRRLHVVTPSASHRVRRPGVVAHRSRQNAISAVDLDGLLVTAPAQTFVQVGVGLRLPDDVVVLGDAFLRRKRMLTSISELQRTAAATTKVKGIAQVRDQLARVRPGTDSPMETRTRLLLTSAGLPCPLVNEVVRLDDGTYVKRCDMYYPGARVAIEYDGDQHRTDKAQWRDDVRRRRWLEEIGVTVIVVVADDVIGDGTRLVARVRQALAR
ncbi:type IV toxin-antitoxin system AbiEi family antitoxin domain-containing protein [Isoptericola chiayiensis]|uniref:Type IV toxin-antitoxin system AbiEi family antitoxin domain-containing protein n=1 Tax=Isoptericola chiayiensis TaxID=579446 RepID=A0ABP8Y3V3_9MICO|nr:DUF559 domain-containing protein [Isoptericola chiayiensis]NOV99514.1 hypothetical protein [Isoptericola chiayiensis]